MSANMSLAQETLKHRLEALPEKMRPHIRMGFHLLSRATPEQRSKFLEYILDITENGENLDRDQAIKLTGLDSHTISDVLSTVAMVIGTTVDTDIDADDFVTFGKEVVFDQVDSDAAYELAEYVINRRAALNLGMKNSALSNSILPSFVSLAVEVDMRIRFDDDSDVPSGGVALAVCNLRTDCTDDIWFQLDLNDVKELIHKLEILEKQLKVADSLSANMLK